jgi:D-serine deaminase-like pyridoxal phosphate-dependent protein
VKPHPDQGLVGVPGGRARLTTPALVLDLDVAERNIAVMAAMARRHGVGLRPHAKTHKSPDLARLQAHAGACGITCATLGEAEAMVEAGVAGVLLSSPMTGPSKVARLIALAVRAGDLMVVVDDEANVAALGAAARAAGALLGVVIDLEVGCGRTGVTTVEGAAHLAAAIAATEGLRFDGLQAYNGAIQSAPGFAERGASLTATYERIAAVRDRLARDGLAPAIVSGGGTGSHAIDMGRGLFTEIQVGSYVVMDAIYRSVDLWGAEAAAPFEVALTVAATVISGSHDGFVTTDAGLKAFATDSGDPVILTGAPAGATYTFMGDEHGRVTFARPADRLVPGAMVSCMAPHCDPTINLYDVYHVIRGDTLVALWPIARGRW